MRRERRGFTLIELLIVVVILGILATIAIPKYAKARERSYLSTVMRDLQNLAITQEIHFNDNLAYATNLAELDFDTSEGVQIEITYSADQSWAATGAHPSVPAQRCGIYVGDDAAGSGGPAARPGVVTCDPE